MAEIINDNKINEKQIIKNFDCLIDKCTVDNLELLSRQLKIYHSHPNLIIKYSSVLKELIQLLFKYLMDGNKNLEEDIIGCFKEEDIFNEIKQIYYMEDYDINCIIIQSLSILIVNIVKSKAFLYFILSNNFVNDLLLIDFSKYDDEYFSYYVNFLKSLAMRLDENTFLLFYNERSFCFPLIDCTLKLYNYSNSMTRTVVNNIILQILKTNIEKVYEYFTILPSVNYFSFISFRMKDIINELCNNINNIDPYEDLIDLTMFINDLLSLKHQKINYIVRNSIFYYFLLPDIFQCLYVLIYGYSTIKNNPKKSHNNKKESVVILCLLTFLLNIKDETIIYAILQIMLSEFIPEKIEKYILNTPETNPFYNYKWNKDFQKDINFTKFISLNYSNKFLASFLNSDNFYFTNIKRIQYDINRELDIIKVKSEETNIKSKIDKSNKETVNFIISQFIFDLFNHDVNGFVFMKNYHYNLSNGLGVKTGVIKEVMHNPNEKEFTNKKKIDQKNNNKFDYKKTDIIENSFMFDYKIWMENLNNNDIKYKANIFKIILFNLLNNENNININISLLIVINYFLWVVMHKLHIPKAILNNFHIHVFTNNDTNDIKEENNKAEETPDGSNNLYSRFLFDKDYISKKIGANQKDNYLTNSILIERLCSNLENKILLAKVELIYVELICKNINSLCLVSDPNKEKIIKTLKETLNKIIKLLINFLQIPESGFIEKGSSIEENICIFLQQMASNIYNESLYDQQLTNLTKIMEIIADYEVDKNIQKGNIVKNMILIVLYLINIIERLTEKNKNRFFKCLYKKVKYSLQNLLDEKDSIDENKKRFSILFEQTNKIVFYDELFFYYCYTDKGRNSEVEINDIFFIKNSKVASSQIKNKINFKINNNIILSCDNSEAEIIKSLEEKCKLLKDCCPKNYEKYNLNNILKYVENL